MNNLIHIRENFLSAEEVELLLKELPQFLQDINHVIAHTHAAFGFPNSAEAALFLTTDTMKPLTGKDSTDRALRLLTDILFRIRQEIATTYNQELSPVQYIFNRILPGGENPVHVDDATGMYNELEYSGLLYLGDQGTDFTGGEIVFPAQELVIQQKKGMLVFFKGDSLVPHGVNKVLSGHRDNLISFFTSPERVTSDTSNRDEII